MGRYFFIVIIFTTIVLSTGCKKQQHSWPDMHSGWVFKNEQDSAWHSATVPGSVQSDLRAHQLIDPPFYRDNEKNIQWIDKKNWIYKKEFTFHRDQLYGEQGWLTFEGLDTYAKVYLNDTLIWATENMFVGKSIRVDPLLKNGKNILKIFFESPVKATLRYYNRLNYNLPVSANDNDTLGGIPGKRISVFARKAPVQFGWDFAPRILTTGIWRSVHFEKRPEAHIQQISIDQKSLNVDSAIVDFNVKLYSVGPLKSALKLKIKGEVDRTYPLELPAGVSEHRFTMKIDDPELWWPRGYGDQHMYTVEAKLSRDKNHDDELSARFGLRSVELVQEPDSAGASFYFKINDTPVFARGANMVPLNILPADVTQTAIRDLLEKVVDANMNMVRVWGGGIYQRNYFYELCDSLGLLVWQDFMFACSMVPDYPGYFENVKHEVKYNVTRLKNHPSIVAWCGNNEVISAWNNWGWEKRVVRNQGRRVADKIYQSYDTLFHSIIPNVLSQHDPYRPYWSSSPQSAPGVPKSDTSGDRHYWMVWWGKAPFESYQTNYGRFMSEYGFQSIPSLSSLGLFMREADFSLRSPGFSNHQKSTGGNDRLMHYLDRYYTSETSFNNYPFLTQLLQARAMETAISTHRKKKPYCMGSLMWQLNDCWPAVSWSMVDFYGKKKAAYYAIKKAFNPVSIFADTLTQPFRLTIVNDDPDTEEVRYKLTVMDFYGKVFQKYTDEVEVSCDSNLVVNFDPELFKGFDPREMLLYLEFKDDGGWHESVLTLVDDNMLKLPRSQFAYELSEDNDGAILEVTSPVFIRSMFVNFMPYDVSFSSNFVDMLPDRTYEFKVSTKVDFKRLESSIRFKNVNGIIDDIQN